MTVLAFLLALIFILWLFGTSDHAAAGVQVGPWHDERAERGGDE